jgi:hypothetical protein
MQADRRTAIQTTRVVALYDIHGHLPALDAVLSKVELIAPDLVLVGGDVASGPMPAATLDRLVRLDFPITWIRGNSDRELAGAFDRRDDPDDQAAPDLWQTLSLGSEYAHRGASPTVGQLPGDGDGGGGWAGVRALLPRIAAQ